MFEKLIPPITPQIVAITFFKCFFLRETNSVQTISLEPIKIFILKKVIAGYVTCETMLSHAISTGSEALVKKNSEVPSYALSFVAKLINCKFLQGLPFVK